MAGFAQSQPISTPQGVVEKSTNLAAPDANLERRFIYNGIANKSQSERHAHVILRAKERADVVLSPVTVAHIEGEIAEVRRRAAIGLPMVAGSARRVAKFGWPYKRDYYEVVLRGRRHRFVWSRRCNGLISFVWPLSPNNLPARHKP
jgi:hypothetical protein